MSNINSNINTAANQEPELAACECCGALVPVDSLVESSDGLRICEDCVSNEYSRCEECGELVRNDVLHEVHTAWRSVSYVCEDCLEDSFGHFFMCADCDEWYDDRYVGRYGTPDGDVCEDCYDENWETCQQCGDVIRSYNAVYVDDADGYLCEDCFRSMQSARAIHDYGYKPQAVFHTRKGVFTSLPSGFDQLTFGVELEVDKGDVDPEDCAREVQDITDALYIKHDGSLSYGFEIVTHPCTLAYHQYKFPWKHVAKTCLAGGFKSHDARTCGLHVHVGRDQLGTDSDSRARTAAKIVLLVDRHWDNLVKFSRRHDNQLEHWAARPGVVSDLMAMGSFSEALALDTALATRQRGRYMAVNLCNFHTVEFRLFNGTLKRDTIIATLQLVSNICRYAMTHTVAEVLNSSFAEVATIEQYKELDAYIPTRGITFGGDPAGSEPVAPEFMVGDRVVYVAADDIDLAGHTGMVLFADYHNPLSLGVAWDDFDGGHNFAGEMPSSLSPYCGYWVRPSAVAHIHPTSAN